MRYKLLIAAALLTTASFAQRDWSRYRLYVGDDKAAERVTNSSLGLYSEDVVIGETDVIVGPGELPTLKRLNIPFKRVGPLPRPDSYNRDITDGDPPDYRYNYLRYDEIIAQYEIWRAQRPFLIEREQIGTSHQGRPIWVYRLNNPSLAAEPIPVFIQGGIHAREWISPPVVMYIFETLMKSGLLGLADWYLLSRFDLSVVPVVNPDGYEFTWTDNRFWRKNRRVNGGGRIRVDLNRNYSKAWGGEGSSGDPNSDTYRGPFAFSEPEVACLRDYLNTIRGLRGAIDYHSYGQHILYPWSYTYDPPPDETWLHAMGEAYRLGIQNAGGLPYDNGQGSINLYIAAGTSKDYYYDHHGAAAYTLELRDQGNYGFDLPPSQIFPTQKENWAGFRRWLFALLK